MAQARLHRPVRQVPFNEMTLDQQAADLKKRAAYLYDNSSPQDEPTLLRCCGTMNSLFCCLLGCCGPAQFEIVKPVFKLFGLCVGLMTLKAGADLDMKKQFDIDSEIYRNNMEKKSVHFKRT